MWTYMSIYFKIVQFESFYSDIYTPLKHSVREWPSDIVSMHSHIESIYKSKLLLKGHFFVFLAKLELDWRPKMGESLVFDLRSLIMSPLSSSSQSWQQEIHFTLILLAPWFVERNVWKIIKKTNPFGAQIPPIDGWTNVLSQYVKISPCTR